MNSHEEDAARIAAPMEAWVVHKRRPLPPAIKHIHSSSSQILQRVGLVRLRSIGRLLGKNHVPGAARAIILIEQSQ
jgi:hypothetical protein